MKILIVVLSLLWSGVALADCPSGFKCKDIQWKSLTCQDLRNAIVNNEAVSYGSTPVFNKAYAPEHSDRISFCREEYGFKYTSRLATNVRTSDTWNCAIYDIAFKCKRKYNHRR